MDEEKVKRLWKELGYKNPNLKLEKMSSKRVSEIMTEILKEYIMYKKEVEYKKYNKQDKEIFDKGLSFFEKDDRSWLYRCIPLNIRKNLEKARPGSLALDSKIIELVKIRYGELAVILRK